MIRLRAATVALGAALLTLGGVAALATHDMAAFLATQRWVEHSHRVIEQVDTLLPAMVDAETGQRGYLLSGDETFLDLYHRGSAAIAPAIAELRRMTADNPEQQRNLDLLAPLCQHRQELEEQVLADIRAHGLQAAGESIRHSEGRRAMDAVRERVAAMAALERRLLDEREGESERRGHLTIAVVAGGGLASLITAGVVGLAMLREARRRAVAEDERDRFFTSALDLLGIAGFDGRFQRVNPAFMRVLGWSEAELTQRPFVSFVHPDDVEATVREAGRLAQGAETVGFENRYQCKDGTWRWLMWSSTADTARGLIYAVARDITERKHMEDELRMQQAQLTRALAEVRSNAVALERSNRELREFAHVASHDLQEPLRMVSSYCAMLAESYRGKLGADADEMIGFAVDGAKRMQVLIQDLLSYARVENRGVALERVALSDAAAEAIANLSRAIDEAHGEVVVGELPEVSADPRLMTQLLQNLIGNALKYRSDAPPRVALSARRIDSAWQLDVADNGIGIAPRHHERIFGMFKRLHGRDRYAGNGIGLAICKKIAELHGGGIVVESDTGKGAIFRFTIPDAPAGAPATETVA